MSFDSSSLLKISDFAEVKGGKRMPTGTSLVSQKTKHPYIRIVDFKDGSIDKTNLQFVPDDVFPKISRYVITSDDLYISIVGTIGLVGTVPDELSGANLTENAAKICQIDISKVNRDYLGYFLRSDIGQNAIRALAVGSTQPKLALFRIEQIEVPCPPIQIQREIAETLGAIDNRITLLRETNATLEAIAQALFKSWFVDFDPVHANSGTQAPSLPSEIQALFPATFTDSPKGPIPDEWRWGTIADLAVLNPESWTAKKHPNTVAYIDLANAKDNVIADIAEFEFDAAPSRARRVLRDGDTIVGTVRPGNRSFAFIHGAANNLTGSTGFAVLRPKHEKNTAFTYLAATNDSSIDYLTHIADGGAYPAVKPEVVANLACIVPPVEVLEAFNSVTAELLRKITKNQQQAQVIANLRDTLLPRLISGQMRLPEAEQAITAITD